MKDIIQFFKDLDDEEKIATIFAAFCIGIMLFVILFLGWVVLTDEYTVIENVSSKCEIYEHVFKGHNVTSKCTKLTTTTTYICKMENGETFATCKDSKRCEEVCNKLRND